MNFLTIASFATAWLTLWIALIALLLLIYPYIRKYFFRLDVSYASTLLLCIVAVPMLFSLFSVTLLYFPQAEALFVGEHCHNDCTNHLPLFNSTLIAFSGLAILSLILCALIAKSFQQTLAVRRLSRQLRALSDEENTNDYRLLHTPVPLVFTVGILHNTIYLSEGLRSACNTDELEIVFSHEQAHMLRKDNLRILIARVLTMLLPGKLVSQLHSDLQLLTESACDSRAAKQYGKFRVAETFLKIQRLVPKIDQLPYGLSSINGAEVEQRIHTLLHKEDLYRPSPTMTVVFTTMLISALAFCINPLHHLIESIFLFN